MGKNIKDSEIYEFRGLPLTNPICEILIKKLFSGTTLKRSDMVNHLYEYHKSRGGLDPEAKDFTRAVKKVLEKLRDQQPPVVKNEELRTGYWTVFGNEEPNPIKPTPVKVVEETENVFTADFVLGDGKDNLYVYYLPAYKKLAQYEGKDTWRCKIGVAGDPPSRIKSQAGNTGHPEKFYYAIRLKTNHRRYWELAIQNILKARKRWAKDAGGTEWFHTNPEEVLNIIRFIDPGLDNLPD